jgi:hypothetical protein
MSLLNILNAIPAAASRFGGSVIQQAPKAAARLPQAARSAGFDPLNQVPAFFSRFGGSAIQAPATRNIQSLRGIVPVAGAGMAGFSGAALDPLLRGSQYAQQQLQGLGLMATPGRRVGSIPSEDKTGESYRDAELRLSAAARAAGGPSAGGGIGGGNMGSSLNAGLAASTPGFTTPQEERAYQQEKSRVAQLTAQDPELQRYEAARLKAVAPGATQEQVQSAEDIGMQIWAQRNPTLAAKVKPGQAGYDVIQGTLAGQAVAEGYGYQMPQQIMMTPPPGVNAPQGLPAVQSIAPTETYGAKGLEVDPEMRKKFQALLNQTQAQ